MQCKTSRHICPFQLTISSVNRTQKHFSLQNLIAQAEYVNNFCVTGAHRIITVCNSLLLRSISPLLKNIMTGSGKISFFFPVIHGTGCPIKQFTLYEKALIFRLFLAQPCHYTHFKADSASFKMSTHTLHRCQQ